MTAKPALDAEPGLVTPSPGCPLTGARPGTLAGRGGCAENAAGPDETSATNEHVPASSAGNTANSDHDGQAVGAVSSARTHTVDGEPYTDLERTDRAGTSTSVAGQAEPAAAAETTPGSRGAARPATPAVRLSGARLAFGERVLWDGLDLRVEPGEFIAVLGPNGSGKTSMLRMLLGQLTLSAGTAEISGTPARLGNPAIGYVPQQKTIEGGAQLRGIDLVGLGVDGHRWGFGFKGRKERKRKVIEAIASVGAEKFAYAPLDALSGGEQQRLRVAQALAGDPQVLLCDEPLLSLDLANQQLVSELIDRRRRTHDTAVLFVTHEINPILPLVDRVLYLVDGQFRIGTPDEVMTSETLSELYGTEVDVLRVRGRLVVVGTGDAMDALGESGAQHCHGENRRTSESEVRA